MKRCGCRKQPLRLFIRSLLKPLLSILKQFTKRVSLNKKQLVRLTYKFSKKAADEKACSEFIEFEKKQRLLKEAEGEKDIVGLLKWNKQAKR